MKIVFFDQKGFLYRQTIEAITCPINRHWTRVRYRCDDWGLFRNPNWLIIHYIENGGAEEFAKHRPTFLREIEIPDEGVYEI